MNIRFSSFRIRIRIFFSSRIRIRGKKCRILIPAYMNLKINSILQVYGRVQQDDSALQRFRAWRVGEDHFSVRQGKDFNHIFSLLFSEFLASIKIGVLFC